MREIHQEYLTGERALFMERDLMIYDTVFADGESPLKESRDIELFGCQFKWRYPVWYANNIKMHDCNVFVGGRAGMWYSNDIVVDGGVIEAPKCFRRCDRLEIKNVYIPNAEETLWSCKNVKLEGSTVHGDNFAMNSENIEVDGLTLNGKYSFDGTKNVNIRNSRLITKDAFWNSENVTVRDSLVIGEYLGWNAKNLTLINCTVESLQGMCYIENLKMINCKLINTTLAFEYSTVEADIVGRIDSVFNPTSGHITADSIDELIIEKDKVDPNRTVITCRK